MAAEALLSAGRLCAAVQMLLPLLLRLLLPAWLASLMHALHFVQKRPFSSAALPSPRAMVR